MTSVCQVYYGKIKKKRGAIMKKSVQTLFKNRLPGKKTMGWGGNCSYLSSEELWERLSGFPLIGEKDRKELRAIVAASAALATVKKAGERISTALPVMTKSIM
jgi:hypothetical protein